MNRFKKPEDYPVAVKVIVTSKTDNRDNTAIFELQTIYVDFAVFSPVKLQSVVAVEPK